MAATPAFAVRLDAFLRVKPFVSTEETHYYLNGIYVDNLPDGTPVCVATNGHQIGIRRTEDSLVITPTIVRVPREIANWKPETKLFGSPWLVGMSTGNGNGWVAIVDTGSDADGNDTAQHAIDRVEECTLRVGRAFIDGTFPDWAKVVPHRAPEGPSRTFNADYLKAFTTKASRQITIVGENKDQPHLVQVHGDPDFLGVVMPMRGDDGKVPAWLAASTVEVRKAA